jgi:hypothetical protein
MFRLAETTDDPLARLDERVGLDKRLFGLCLDRAWTRA